MVVDLQAEPRPGGRAFSFCSGRLSNPWRAWEERLRSQFSALSSHLPLQILQIAALFFPRRLWYLFSVKWQWSLPSCFGRIANQADNSYESTDVER
jgi:hypothetical protein